MRLPSPTTALAFLASMGLHGGMLAFAISGGAPRGLPDGSVPLTVDIVSQEQATALARAGVGTSDPVTGEGGPPKEGREDSREDRRPVAMDGEVVAKPSPGQDARIIGSNESSLALAQGPGDPSAKLLAPASEEPPKPKGPKAGDKPAVPGQRARRKAAPQAKPEARQAQSKSASDGAPEAPTAPGEESRRVASAGTPGRNAPFFPPSMRDGLIDLLQQQIERCYTTPAGASKRVVLPVIGIRLDRGGRLMDNPSIVRSGKTPVDAALAQAALAAVRRCAPYRIPALYAPYYDAWKDIAAEFEFSGS